MSAGDNTPWIAEGSLRVRYREEQGHLVKEWDQPDRGIILDHVAELRKQEQTNKEGWLIGSIPTLDYERVVLPKYPEFRHGDAEQRKKALIRFSNDPDMSIYMVKKA